MTGAGTYTGRFAPSPTGPLHFGSLLAAMASYLEARSNDGRWLVRIEDIDPPRAQAGADRLIVDALERYGFEWDGVVTYQSRSDTAHRAALDSLIDRGLAYRCTCSRKTLSDEPRGPLGIIYPGTCRGGSDGEEFAIRLETNDTPIRFVDRLQGPQEQRLESESGDFVIGRRDGLIAYHLAVVVDDHLQGITEIVRGIDLMDSTPRQIWVQQCLEYATPEYAHIPVAIHPDGSKLSKLTGAAPVPELGVERILVDALASLGQQPPDDLVEHGVNDIWLWARQNWRIDAMIGKQSVPTPMAARGQGPVQDTTAG